MIRKITSVFSRSVVFAALFFTLQLISGKGYGQTSGLVISQLYPGGGNSGATYKTKFVELFNPTTSPIVITNWTIEYYASSGNFGSSVTIPSATIPAGAYYLIQGASGGTGAALSPGSDITLTGFSPSGSAGYVILVSSTTTLGASISSSTGATIVDFVGYGSVTLYEGAGHAPAPTDNTKALFRGPSGSPTGCQDLNSNDLDFSNAAVTPRNSATAVVSSCPATNYYCKGSGAFTTLSNWGTATDGTGTAPLNFTGARQIFNIANSNTAGMTAAWTVSGFTSKVVVATTDLTIGASTTLTGTVDVNAGRTLTLSNAASPIFGALDPTSTIVFNNNVANTLQYNLPYGSMIFLGSSSVTNPGASSNLWLYGNLTLKNTATIVATNLNVIVKGTTAQVVNGGSNTLSIRNLTVYPTQGKTGTFSLANGNTPLIVNNSLNFYSASSASMISDSGNAISVVNNATFGGDTSGYNFTGTLTFASPTSGTQKVNGDTVNQTTQAKANFKNIAIQLGGSSSVSFIASTPNYYVIKGNFSVNSVGTGSVTLGANTINIGGNFVYAPSSTTTLVTTGSTVVFNGLVAQTYSTNATGGTPFANVKMNNSAGLTLTTGNLKVSGTLDLTSGNISTTATDTVAINTGGSVINASASSYVNGYLRKIPTTGTSTSLYEVGNSSFYTPIKFNFTGITGGSAFLSVKSTAGLHPNIGTSSINTADYLPSYWTFVSAVTGSSATISTELSYASSSITGGACNSSFIVNKFASAAWSLPTATNTTVSSGGGLLGYSSTASGLASGAVISLTGDYVVGSSSTISLTGSGTVPVGTSIPFAGSPSGGGGSSAWVSTAPSVATVNSSGVVTGLTTGATVISYTYTNSCSASRTASLNVNVSNLPKISSVSPNIAVEPGTQITISGTNFNGTPVNNAVFFGATKATPIAGSSTTLLTVTVPSGATYSPISVVDVVSGEQAWEGQVYQKAILPFLPSFSNALFLPDSLNFKAKVDITAGTVPFGAAIGDMDGDGIPDLVSNNNFGSSIYIYRNVTSSGTITLSSFTAPSGQAIQATSGTTPNNVKLADLDGDGKLDIVVCMNTGSTGGTMNIWKNNSTSGSFSFSRQNPLAFSNQGVASIADFDNDGRPDIMVSQTSVGGVVGILRNISGTSASLTSASFANSVTVLSGGVAINSVCSADFDKDGKPDVAAVDYFNGVANGVIRLARNISSPGTIAFGSQSTINTPVGLVDIQPADMDGDGKIDIVVTNRLTSTASVYLNTSTDTTFISFAASFDLPMGSLDTTTGVALADLNGDGKVDIVVSNTKSNKISIFRNKSTSGALAFDTRRDLTTGTGPVTVTVGDLNGDHFPDIVVGNSLAGTISVFQNYPLPKVNSITGTLSVCAGGVTTLSSTTTGGTWLVSNSSLATVSSVSGTDGLVTAFAATTSNTVTITYRVIAGGDTNTASAVVTINAQPASVSATATPNPICAGSTLTVSGNATGATTYSWSYPDGSTATDLHPASFTSSTLSAGIYTFTATTANGCFSVVTTPSVTVSTPPTLVTASVTPTTACVGSSVSLTGSASGASSYFWQGPNLFSSTNATPPAFSATVASAGIYTFSATSGACTVNATTTLNVNVPSATISGAPFISPGASTTLTISGTIADAGDVVGYTWTGGGTSTVTLDGSGVFILTVSPSTTTTYSLTSATSTLGCTTIITGQSATVTISNATITGATTICQGGTTTIYFTGPASGQLAYNRDGGTTQTVTLDGSGNRSIVTPALSSTSVFNLTAVTSPYSATISGQSTTITVTPSSVNSVSIAASPAGSVCAGTTVTLTATPVNGGATPTYQWKVNGSAVAGATNATYGFVPANGDAVVCQMASSAVCPSPALATSSVLSMTVTAYPSAGTISGPATVCTTSPVTFTDGAGSGVWSSSAGTIATVDAASGLVTGLQAGTANISYTVTTSGCATYTLQAITVSTPPTTVTATPSATTLCNGAILTLTGSATGATSYSWSGPNGYTASVQNPAAFSISSAYAGIYTLTATNTCGNTNATTAAITINVAPTGVSATPSATTVCTGNTLTLTASATGATSYSWSGPNSFNSALNPATVTIGTASAGIYTLLATNSCGSTTVTTASITVNPSVTGVGITATPSATLCSGAVLTLTGAATNATSYQWNGPNGFASTALVPASFTVGTASAGVYTLAAINGCGTVTATTTITVNPLPTATVSGTASITSGNSTTLVFGGTASATVYYWNGASTLNTTLSAGGTSTVTVSPTVTTTYSVTSATSVAGCSVSLSGSTAVVTVTAAPVVIYLNNFGSVTATASDVPTTLNANLTTPSPAWTSSTAISSSAGSTGQALTLANSSGTPTMTLTLNVQSGYAMKIDSFSFWRRSSSTGAQNWSMAINGTTVGSGTVPTTGANIGTLNVSSPVNNLTGTVNVVLTLSGASATGTFRLDDFTLKGSVSAIPVYNFYSKSSGYLDVPATWGTNTDGSGTTPTNFTSDYQVFHVANGNTGTYSGSLWTVSGVNANVAIDGTTDLVIPSTTTLSGIVNIGTGRTLTLSNPTFPTIGSMINKGTATSMSTIVYNGLTFTSTFNVPTSTTYGNVVFNNTSVALPTAALNLTFNGNFTLSGSSSFFGGDSTSTTQTVGYNFITNDTAAQTISGNNNLFFVRNFDINNTAGSKSGKVTLSANTPMLVANSTRMNISGAANVFSDGGNMFKVFNNASMGGTSDGYNFTGTLYLAPVASGAIRGYFSGAASSTVAAAPVFNNIIVNNSSTPTMSFAPTTGGATYTIKGNLYIASTGTGATILNPNTINIGGDITHVNSVNTLSPGTSTVILNGTGSQNIYSNVTAASGGLPFNNLTINNGNTVTLGGGINVGGVLGLTSGKIVTGANAISLTATGTTTGGSSTSYVNGSFLKTMPATGTTAMVYEIGDATYSPIKLSFSSSLTSGSITAKSTNGSHPLIASSYIDASNAVNRYWTIAQTGITLPTTVNIDLSYNSSDITGGGANTAFIIRKYDGTSWSTPTTLTNSASGTLPLLLNVSTSTGTSGSAFTGDFIAGNGICSTPVAGTAVAAPNTLCNSGSTTLSLTGASSNAAITYQWKSSTNGTIYSDISGATSSTYTGTISATTYYKCNVSCLLTGNSALSTSATVTVGGAPSAVTATAPATVCNGGTLTLTGSATGATSYSWNGPNSFTATDLNPASFTVGTASAGIYTLTAANSCGTTTTTTTAVTINDVPSAVTAAATPATLCSGNSLTLTGSATNASSYSWNGPNGFTSASQNPAAFTTSTASAGVYNLSAINTCGTVTATTASVTIIAPPAPVIAGSATISLGGTATLTISGAASDVVTYSWTGGGTATVTLDGSGSAIFTVSPSSTTVYSLTTATSAAGCTASLSGSTATVTVDLGCTVAPTAVSANESPSAVCIGGTISLAGAATNALTYSWSGPDGFTSTSLNPAAINISTASTTGIYTLVATNACGSTTVTTTSFTINNVPSGVSATPSATTLCSGNALTLTGAATNATSYSWNGPNSFTSTDQNPAAITVGTASAGVYTLAATNACGTTTATTTPVIINTVPAAVTATPSATTVCNGAVLTLTGAATGGATYSWSGPNGYTATVLNPASFTVNTASAGAYTLTATNTCGNTNASTAAITISDVPGSVIATPSSASVCSGATLTLTGSATGATSYSWSGPNSFSSAFNTANRVTNALSAGAYTLTATNSCGSATATTTSITINALPTASLAGSASISTGASTTLVFTGTASAVVYYWNGGSTVNTTLNGSGSSTVTVTPSVTTTYTLTTATSVAGCSQPVTGSATITVTATGPISLTNAAPTYTQNFDGMANTGATATWTDNTSPIVGWYATQTGGTTTLFPGTYRIDSGSASTGAIYSFGLTNATDRAIGSIASGGTGFLHFGARFINNGTTTITGLTVTYTGEQWRNSGDARVQSDSFYYQVGATGIATGTWVSVPALKFSSPIVGGTATSLNGNLSANKVTNITSTISLNVNPGQEVWIKMVDSNNTGNDHGLAMDDLTVTAIYAAPAVNYYSKSSGSLDVPATWGTNTDGTGTAPTDFVTPSQIFHPANGNSSSFTGSNWTVSGLASKIVLDASTNLVIPNTTTVTGTIDVPAGRMLTIGNTTLPTLGTIDATSTIKYSGITIPAAAATATGIYGNVILDNATFTNPAATTTMNFAGNFTIQNGSSISCTNLNLATAGSADQVINGNGLTFLINNLNNAVANPTKTGKLSLHQNTPITINNSMIMTNFGAANAFSDSANTITIGNNITVGGNSAGYNLTGTILVSAASGTTNVRGTGTGTIPVAQFNNFTVNSAGNVVFNSTNTANTITIKKDFLVLNAGTTISLGNGNTIQIGGNFAYSPATDKILSGTTTTLIGPATVEFNGISGQTYSSGVTGGNTLTNVKVNNSSTGLVLSSPLNVTGTLSLSSGKVVNGNNTLSLGATATVTGGSASTYINGNLSKAILSGGTTTMVYEVGDTTSYAPVRLTFSSSLNSGSVLVKATKGAHPSAATSYIDAANEVNRYWTIIPTAVAPSTINVDLSYNSGDIIGGGSNSAFIIRRYNGTSWSTPTTISNSNAGSAPLQPYVTTTAGQSGSAYSGDYIAGNGICNTPTAGTAVAGATTLCPLGTTTLSLSGASSNAAITYQWKSSPDGVTYNDISGATSATYNATVTATTYYKCNVGCAITNNFVLSAAASVTLSTSPSSVVATAPATVCNGAAMSLTSSAVNATSYSWSGPNFFTATDQNPASFTAGTLSAGVYSLTVTNSCGTATATTTSVAINDVPTGASANASATALCNGATLTLTGSATNATSYSWSNTSGYTATDANPAAFATTSASAGVYTFTATNSCGSITATTASVTINPTPAPVISGSATISLGATATLTITGAAADVVNYSWTGGGSATITLDGSGNGIFTVSPSSTTTYSLTTATSAFGCPATITGQNATVTINLGCTVAPTAVTANLSSTTVCDGGTLTLTGAATNALTYSWAGPDGYSSTNLNPGGHATTTASAGIYTLIATNACGNTTVTTSSLVVNTAPTGVGATPSATSLCSGDALTLTGAATNALTYSWSGPNSFTSTDQNPAAITTNTASAGIYTFTATNTCGNVIVFTSAIIINTLPTAVTATPSSATVCNGATLTLTGAATGATSYSWSGPNGYSAAVLNPASFTVNTASAGAYTLSATNACGTATATTTSITINDVPTAVTATPSATTLCSGTTLTLTASATGAASYSWTGPNSFTSALNPATRTVNTLSAGVYTVAAVNTCGTVTATTASVTVNPAPSAVATASATTLCSGATLTLTGTASGATSYSWSGPNSFTSTALSPASFTVGTASAGIYTLTVSGSCGTLTATTASVTVNSVPVVAAITGTASVNIGSTTTLSDVTTLGTWSSGSTSIATVNNTGVVTGVAAGSALISYTVTNSCGSTSATKVVTVNATATGFTISWNPVSNGSVGSTPWTPATISSSITSPSSGLVRGGNIGSAGTAGCYGGGGGFIPGTTTTLGTSAADNNSMYFIITSTCTSLSLSSIQGATRRSTAGPTTVNVYYALNGATTYTSVGTWNTSVTSGTTGTPGSSTLSGISALQNLPPGTTIKFIFTPIGTTGNWYFTSSNLSLTGTSVSLPAPFTASGPANSTITAGNNTSFIASNVSGASSYQWQRNTSGISGGTWVDITSASLDGGLIYSGQSATTTVSADTLVLTGATLSLNGYGYRCAVTNCAGTTYSSPALLTVIAPAPCAGTPTAGTANAITSSFCATGATTMSTTGTTALGGITYQWQSSSDSLSWSTISGATNNTYATPTLTSSTYYRMLATCSNSGVSDSTNGRKVTINPLPTVVLTPSSTIVCSGGPGVTLTGSGASTYSWTPSASLSASTGSAVNAHPTVNTNYTVTGTSAAGCVGTASVSLTYNLGVSTLTVTPTAIAVCPGASPQRILVSGGIVGPTTVDRGVISSVINGTNNSNSLDTISMVGIPSGVTITGAYIKLDANMIFQNDFVLNLKAPNGNILNLVNRKGQGTGTGFYTNDTISSSSTNAFPVSGTVFSPNTTYQADAANGVGLAPYLSNVTGWSSMWGTPNGNWVLVFSNSSGFSNGNGAVTNWSLTLQYSYRSVTWSPTTNLFTDAAGLSAYSGGARDTVYAKPAVSASSTVYTATSAYVGCSSAANDTFITNSLPVIAGTFNLSPATVCPGNTVTLAFTGTASGTGDGAFVSYNWSGPGSYTSSTVSSTSSFSPSTSAMSGTYSVVATYANPGCVSNVVTSSSPLTVASPTAYSVTGGFGCATSGVTVGLSNSDNSVNYQLYRSGSTVGSALPGTGSALSFGSFTTPGVYKVYADNGSCAQFMNDSATVYDTITVYNITGGGVTSGAGCTTGGIVLAQNGSQMGVSYQLLNGVATVGTPVIGTGSTISFSGGSAVTTAGTYTITATIGSCSRNMSGSSTIYSTLNNYTVTGGTGCTAPGVAVGLSNADLGVTYKLYNNTVATGATITGAGAAIVFGTQTTIGSYTVQATAGGGCATTMTGSAVVYSTPSFTVSPATVGICGAPGTTLTVTPGTAPITVVIETLDGTIANDGWTNDFTGVTWAQSSGSSYTWSAGNSVTGTGLFYVLNDVVGTATSSHLVSPAFSLIGFSAASLTFNSFFDVGTSGETAGADVSINGGTSWTSVFSATNEWSGTNTYPMSAKTISLTPYVGNANVKIRFRYDRSGAGTSFIFAVDNVKVNGTPTAASYAWTPAAGLSATTGSSVTVVPTVTTVYSVSALGCAAGTANVHVDALPTAGTVSASPNSSCITTGAPIVLSEAGTLTGPSGATMTSYSWTGPNSYVSTGTGTSVGNRSITPTTTAQSGIYSLTVTYNEPGCTSAPATSPSVSVTNPPTITVGAFPSLCQPTTLTDISYSGVTGAPTLYNITWGSPATTAGYTPVTSGTLSLSPAQFEVPIPAFGPTGTFSGSVTVATASGCTSSPYSFSVTTYASPTASFTSAVLPCMGNATTIQFSGTPGATVRYSIDGGTAVDALMTGGTVSLTTAALTAPTTYHLINAHNPACAISITKDSVITPVVQQWVGGTASHLTDWNTATNWTCGSTPVVTDDITIAPGTYIPNIASATTGTARNITLLAGASVDISTSATLNIKGNVINKGSITGNGTFALVGTAHQMIDSIGYFNNLELNNPAGATVDTNSSVIINNALTITAGTLATSDSVVLASNSLGSARINAIPATGAAVTGKVRVMQYIEGGYRRFRFLSHPFSTPISLSQVENYIDITGTGGAANGFTGTASNASSAFWYGTYSSNSSLNYDPGWNAFTNITPGATGTNLVQPYQGIRIFVRGAKGEGTGYWFGYTPSPTVIGMTGPVNQGDVAVPLLKGSATTTLGASTQDYNMLGNPYPAPVDLGTVAYNALVAHQITGAAFYVWNPSIGASGFYQAVPINTVSATPYYLQANMAFQVRADHDGATLNFSETNKGTVGTTNLFKTQPESVSLYVYDANYHPWDMLYVKFNDEATEAEDKYLDAAKPSGAEFNFYSLTSDNRKMVIDARPYNADKVVPLGINSAYAQEFIIKAEGVVLPAGGQLFLHDKLLQKYVSLQPGTEYRFAITADKATQGDNRFELSMKPAAVADNSSLHVSMTPNPAVDEVNINFNTGKAQNVSVRVLDMSGVSIYNKDLGLQQSGTVNISLSNFASGVYMVELTSGSEKIVHRLVKE